MLSAAILESKSQCLPNDRMSEGSNFSKWWRAARPQTLAASLSPVILGTAIAFRDGQVKWGAAILCLFVALFAQIASNFANDYFDGKNGIDKPDRFGPKRAVASGEIAPESMLRASIISISASCLCGLALLFYAPWEIIIIGFFIVLCVFGYSAGPYPLSQHALGDAAVILFYGIVPVCFTYFVQAGDFTTPCFIYSIAIGLLSDNILIVNNYRDIEDDREVGKTTTVTLFGRKACRIWYLADILLAATAPLILKFTWFRFADMAVFALLGITIWIELFKKDGSELNVTLSHTSILVLIYAILCSFI
jgi:1,4-dihydroxy-2-naphthoate octaprenyltransferase